MENYKNIIRFDWRSGEISFERVHPSQNGTPMDVYNGLATEWELPYGCLESEEIIEEFREEFGNALEEIRKGFEEKWDGHNFVGRWESEETFEELEAVSYQIEDWTPSCLIEEWDADDYFQYSDASDLGITAETTDTELEKIAEDEEEKAAGERRRLDGTLRCLERFREIERERIETEKEE